LRFFDGIGNEFIEVRAMSTRAETAGFVVGTLTIDTVGRNGERRDGNPGP